MMTSQILKSVDFTKRQKSRYLQNESLFFLQIKKLINYEGSFVAKNNFAAEVTFSVLPGPYYSIKLEKYHMQLLV